MILQYIFVSICPFFFFFLDKFCTGWFSVEYMHYYYLLMPSIKEEIYIFNLIERGSFYYCGGSFKYTNTLNYALISRGCLFNRKKNTYMDKHAHDWPCNIFKDLSVVHFEKNDIKPYSPKLKDKIHYEIYVVCWLIYQPLLIFLQNKKKSMNFQTEIINKTSSIPLNIITQSHS